MRMHVDALFTYDAKGRMVGVNEARDAQAPRIFVGRTTAGYVLRTRADVPETTLNTVEEMITREPSSSPLARQPRCGEAIISLLSRNAPVQRVWSGPAYCIDPAVLPESPDARRITGVDAALLGTFPDWRDEVDERQPFVVTVAKGQAVSLCSSVRITRAAHAAGVETLPAARRSGMASQAVAEWARAVVELGAIPLYSTSWDNLASQGVAHKLRMTMFGVDFHVT